jgi:hypothetical protein
MLVHDIPRENRKGTDDRQKEYLPPGLINLHHHQQVLLSSASKE